MNTINIHASTTVCQSPSGYQKFPSRSDRIPTVPFRGADVGARTWAKAIEDRQRNVRARAIEKFPIPAGVEGQYIHQHMIHHLQSVLKSVSYLSHSWGNPVNRACRQRSMYFHVDQAAEDHIKAGGAIYILLMRSSKRKLDSIRKMVHRMGGSDLWIRIDVCPFLGKVSGGEDIPKSDSDVDAVLFSTVPLPGSAYCIDPRRDIEEAIRHIKPAVFSLASRRRFRCYGGSGELCPPSRTKMVNPEWILLDRYPRAWSPEGAVKERIEAERRGFITRDEVNYIAPGVHVRGRLTWVPPEAAMQFPDGGRAQLLKYADWVRDLYDWRGNLKNPGPDPGGLVYRWWA